MPHNLFNSLQEFKLKSGKTGKYYSLAALEKAGVDLAVSITGIAGPGGATPGKPVGLVHFAVAARDERMLVIPALDNTIRLLPPLTVSDAELDEAIARLDRACGVAEAKLAAEQKQ